MTPMTHPFMSPVDPVRHASQLTRRHFFSRSSLTLGGAALAHLLGRDTAVAQDGPALGGLLLAGFGADSVETLGGVDVVLGDNGTVRFDTAGVIISAVSSEPDIGGADLIAAGDGDNVVLGGLGADRVTSGTGRDFVLEIGRAHV